MIAVYVFVCVTASLLTQARDPRILVAIVNIFVDANKTIHIDSHRILLE